MKRNISLLCLLFLMLAVPVVYAQNYRKEIKPVKNVILMIPDGTSIGVVSAARWYNYYKGLGDNLNIDPYICGTVKTFSSNAPIGDSAPTTSCYMTGVPQQTGNVSIYPPADPNKDIYPVDPQMAYQPLVTILEAAKMQKNKATGLVVTVEFPHATPADCAAHHYNRGAYKYLAPQMAYNNLNVVFGGGNSIITDDIKRHFANNGTRLIQNDIDEFKQITPVQDEKVWALFAEKELPYDVDRDPAKIPSLSEMTEKALEVLSANENGFFLMVEGSKVDWAAHSNDAVGCITEYLAFDKAVGVALDFAKKDGETAIIILPDHGNSGFTIGRAGLNRYDKASLEDLFGNVTKFKRTAEGLERILLKEKPDNFKSVFKENTGIEITKEELNKLLSSKNYKEADYMKKSESENMVRTIVSILNSRTYFGFTSGGHTGEEVFLAAYHPQGDIPLGMNTNIDINRYLFSVLGLQTDLADMTKQVFAKHTDVFAGLKCKVSNEHDFPVLTVKKDNEILKIPAYKSVAYLNEVPFDVGSVVVYIDKTKTFYLPANLIEKLK
ncbi:alkaline phosphatase [Dysgonomonas sp. 216]|uniref:alkaline phosphatase n=1 Tax=Dysgonomonas sp. 216 TaxID=2302934 RepID=UPI0013D2DF30|nr:alkaline phosphatase [Dysgonomonas sp. 216]NDW18147.1 alkaline phosphatase [Dysgonomonas sp. 216]